MNNSKKMNGIRLGILLGLCLPFLGPLLKIDETKLTSIDALVFGFMLTVFYREISAERYRTNQETNNKFLKEFFAGEKLERDRIITLLIGICFLIGGLIVAAGS